MLILKTKTFVKIPSSDFICPTEIENFEHVLSERLNFQQRGS